MSLLRRTLDASVRPLHLAAPVVGVAVSVGLVGVGLHWLAVGALTLSMATWGAMVAWDVARRSREPVAVPAPEPVPWEAFESAQIARAYKAIALGAEKVRSAVASHDGVLTASLLEVQAHCDELVVASDGMARRGDALLRFLGTHDPGELRRMADEHTRQARATRDPEVVASLRAAAEAKRRQLETLEELRTLYERIVAELLVVEATLGELHTRVVKLTFDDPAHAVTAAGSVGGELDSVRRRVQLLERSAATTLRELA